MKYPLCVVLLLIATSAVAEFEPDVVIDPCETPEVCAAKLELVINRTESVNVYPTGPEVGVLKRLLALGDGGMQQIMSLLESDDPHLARDAAIALREANFIDPKYLPQITAGLKRDVPWLAPALGRVGTLEAAELAVRKFLVSEGRPHNQEAYALTLLGEIMLPFFLKAMSCEYECEADTYDNLHYILKELEDLDKPIFATALMDLVTLDSTPLEVKQATLEGIAMLGPAAKNIEQRLVDMLNREPLLAEEVKSSLAGIKASLSAEIYSERLREMPDQFSLPKLASLGKAGYAAGPVLLDLLSSDDVSMRHAAARTLGFIQYLPAAEQLMTLLSDDRDIQMVWIAVESLRMMRGTEARDVLERMSQAHWYPPVVAVAREAVVQIDSGEPFVYQGGAIDDDFYPSKFYEYDHFRLKPCENTALQTLDEDHEVKLYQTNDENQLAALSLEFEHVYFVADGEYIGNNEIISDVKNEDGLYEVRSRFEFVPTVALKSSSGWLLGINQGEFGGGLAYLSDTGDGQELLSVNTTDIYHYGGKYLAFTGISHLFTNTGSIYWLTANAAGHWEAKLWITLPGAPYKVRRVETGELLIDTVSGGSLLMNEHGEFRMADCVEAAE